MGMPQTPISLADGPDEIPAQMLFTVGHSNHEVGSFFALLQKYRIFGLVDVRSIPSSGRFPQFKKRQFEKLCNDRGVTYRHCPELGNKLGGIYHLLQRPEGHEALQDLVASSTGCGRPDGDWAERHKWVAFMCAEAEWTDCHRQVIAQVLTHEYNVAVRHILRDGTSEPHPPDYQVSAGLRAQMHQPPPTDEEVAVALGKTPPSSGYVAAGNDVAGASKGVEIGRRSVDNVPSLMASGSATPPDRIHKAGSQATGAATSAAVAAHVSASPPDVSLPEAGAVAPQIIKRRWGKTKDCC